MTSLSASLAHRVDAIVIGASAGGVEVLSVLLPALPATLRAPVFVVLHQPPDRRSVLTEIFRRKCALPVHEAEDKEPVEPGTVYFAPPNYHLLIERGPSLALSIDGLVQFSRPSIDVLFQSAAEVYGRGLLGVVLTGWNEDAPGARYHRGAGPWHGRGARDAAGGPCALRAGLRAGAGGARGSLAQPGLADVR
jgi:two-component system chemotaxis response regulator CheB